MAAMHDQQTILVDEFLICNRQAAVASAAITA